MKNKTLVIRQYLPEDKLKLIELFKLNIPTFFDPKELIDFTNYLEQRTDTYFTLVIEKTIIGGIGNFVCEEDSSGRISWIFIHPHQTGNGYGKQAVDYSLKLLRNNSSIKTLIVETSQHAHEFFSTFGYNLVKKEKDYWGEGLDLYLMEQAV